jgi:hypothetical protein
MDKSLAVFEGNRIRRYYDEETETWYFSVVDVVQALTGSPTPRQYWGKVKKREFVDIQLSPIWVRLKLESPDGKKGGGIAQRARKELEDKTGRKVITGDNFLPPAHKARKIDTKE